MAKRRPGTGAVFPGAGPYTGETVLELHGHGGPAVLAQILRRWLDPAHGSPSPANSPSGRSLNGKTIWRKPRASPTSSRGDGDRARRGAQLSGAFSAEVRALVDRLTNPMFTEATLDFPDEDTEFMQRADAVGKFASLRERLDSIAARSRQKPLARIPTSLIGPAHVGKSSLMNQLAGDDIAIVTPCWHDARCHPRQRRNSRHSAAHHRHRGLRERRPDRAYRHRRTGRRSPAPIWR